MINYEFPHRLFLVRGNHEAKPSRPAPMSSHDPSDKVKSGLAEILPKIEAIKEAEPIEETADTQEN